MDTLDKVFWNWDFCDVYLLNCIIDSIKIDLIFFPIIIKITKKFIKLSCVEFSQLGEMIDSGEFDLFIDLNGYPYKLSIKRGENNSYLYNDPDGYGQLIVTMQNLSNFAKAEGEVIWPMTPCVLLTVNSLCNEERSDEEMRMCKS